MEVRRMRSESEMNLREAAQQAINALCEFKESAQYNSVYAKAIDALRAALAEATIKDNLTVKPVAYVTGFSKGYATVQPVDPCLLMCVGMALYRSPPTINEMETVEPVAWISEVVCVGPNLGVKRYDKLPIQSLQPGFYKHTPLYTAQPKRKPLTDDEIRRIDDATPFHEDVEWEVRFTRAIEQAHGIGGKE